MADELYYDKERKAYSNTPPQVVGAGEGVPADLEEKLSRRERGAGAGRGNVNPEPVKKAKGGAVRGWGKARGARAAKNY